MPYNQTPIDVWGSFAQGMEIGGALRRQSQQRAYGDAYQQGGWGAVGETAGGFGDLQTAEAAQSVQGQQEERAIARAQRNATVLSNAATSLLGVPYEQRGQRLQQMAPMLEEMGLDPGQIAQFDPTDEALAGVRALQGQFSQFEDIREVDGAIVGVMANGQTQVLREAQPQWQDIPPDQLPAGARFGQRNQRTGQANIEFTSTGAGGVQYRPMTAEEAQAYGITNPSDFAIGSNGLPRRVGGGGTFPAEQRARVAITYDAAHEAAQYLEQAEGQAVRRQGSHVADTPLGQDMGARIVDGIPLVGDAMSRAVGGEDYQQYVRASSSFESAMLPILSGAAVTESEARRVIRAALPQLNDSRETLQAKARQRQQMLNGAALIGGRPLPYPDMGVPAWAQNAPRDAAPEAGVGLESLTDEQLDQLEQELMNGGR